MHREVPLIVQQDQLPGTAPPRSAGRPRRPRRPATSLLVAARRGGTNLRQHLRRASAAGLGGTGTAGGLGIVCLEVMAGGKAANGEGAQAPVAGLLVAAAEQSATADQTMPRPWLAPRRIRPATTCSR